MAVAKTFLYLKIQDIQAKSVANDLGEALNVLLRLLNERQYNGPSTGDLVHQLPLRTAIATSNPSDPGSRYYTEPLDPACLDRFVLQLQSDGAVSAGRWDEEPISSFFALSSSHIKSSYSLNHV